MTNLFGSDASFTVAATGQTPLYYQWSFGGVNLTNSAHIGGATNSTLTVSNVTAMDAGNYLAVVANSHGSATSAVATLTVLLPPGISAIPNQRTFRGVATRAIPFAISNAAAFTISASSSDTNLAPTNNITWGGTGTNGTIRVTPAAGLTGTATITVTVTDSYNRTASTAFSVAVGDLTAVAANLPGAYWGTIRWVDFDNDGRLDLFLSGSDTNYAPHTWLLHNNGDGTFTEVSTPFLNWTASAADWADYDNDGFLDLVFTGCYDPNSGYGYTQIFHNNGGTNFTLVTSLPTSYTEAQVAWSDFDNDGKPDVLLAEGVFSVVFHNNGDGTFSQSTTLPGSYGPAVADYDNDGWRDVALPGYPSSQLYRNTGTNTFVNSGLGFPATYGGFAAWGDYNNDGNVDLLLTGFADTPDSTLTQLSRNNGNGAFTTVTNALPSLRDSVAAWGDFDNDGNLDVFMAGYGGGYQAKVFRNTGGDTFADFGSVMPGFIRGAVALGDYDNDGALDLAFTGAVGNSTPTTMLFHNDGAMPDTPPTAPTGLTVTLGRNSALLSWNAATDAEQAGGLTYNVRLGTTTNGINVVSPNADLVTGFCRVPKDGNAGYRRSFLITNLPAGNYFWSVQAIDHAYKGSLFAAEQSFTLPAPVITNQPQNLAVFAGASATFTVGVTGTPPISYQWQFNGTNLPDATNSVLTINPAVFANQGVYSVSVSNPYGVIGSSNATLTVFTPPSLTLQPQSQGGVVGNFMTFSAAATGSAPFGYQWFFNGTPLSDNGHSIGASSNVLTMASILTTDAGSYWLAVTNNYGSVTSAVA
ncbi:MAG TPA: FG-GAP-like repeat-containing protein, partial [Verrucomicrobiae bacterium]